MLSQKFRNDLPNFSILVFLLKWLVISAAIGLLVGSASAFFLISLDWATSWREDHRWIIALLPIGGTAVGLLYHYWGKEVEGGNNLLLDNIHSPGKIIPLKMAPLVLIGTIATHFFGGSAGREGTALQMGGSISDQLTSLFKLHRRDRKLILIAGIAAGFGSVFGTPLAGAVFALEVFVIGRLSYSALFPAFAASILADLTTRAWKVGHTHYHISSIPDYSFGNIGWSILAGIAFGICSVAFSEATRITGSFFKSKIDYPPFRPLVGGVLVASLVWLCGSTKYIGLGIPVIVDAFNTHLPAYDFAIKILFTVLTLGAAFKGGEVTPLFFIGATLGNALSGIIPLPISLLAGMGFVAVFSGAANTPLACTVMALELFGVECGVYVAIACITSYLVSGHKGIYQSQIVGQTKLPVNIRHSGKSLKNIISSRKP